MIVLPDEDELSVGAQVNAVIGEALRQSVADVEPSPGFEARLAAALDTAEQGGHARRASALAGERAAEVKAAGEDGRAGEAEGEQGGQVERGAGQGSEAAEATS